LEIKKEEIVAYEINGETVCPDCIDNDDLENITQDEIITENEVNDDAMAYFEEKYKENMTLEEAIDMGIKAISKRV